MNRCGFGSGFTFVFWYIDDCPIPNDIKPESIYDNILSAIRKMGYHIPVTNFTISTCGKEKLGPQYSRDHFFSIADDGYSERGFDFVVISKTLPNDPEFNRVLYGVKPTDHSGPSQGVDIMNPDFSNPIKLDIPALRTGIFWDVVDCPIPDDIDPLIIYERIRDSLKSKGYKYVGQMSIWAYAEKKTFSDEMLAKFREARFYFIPEVLEDKYDRRQRMIHDMLLCTLDSPVDGRAPPHLIVISNNFSGEVNLTISLEFFNMRGYNVFLVLSDAPGEPTSSVWPECLIGRGKSIGSMITSYKPMRKKKPKVKSPKAEDQS